MIAKPNDMAALRYYVIRQCMAVIVTWCYVDPEWTGHDVSFSKTSSEIFSLQSGILPL